MYWRCTPTVASPVFLLSGLVQRRDHQRLISQLPDHEPTYDPHRLLVIPHRVVEQPLGRIGGGVPGVLADGPAVLAGQVAHQRRDVLAGLGMRAGTGETRPQLLVQRGQVRCRTVALYDGSRSRLRMVLPHNMMILRRLPY
jgi:hypothetical protein